MTEPPPRPTRGEINMASTPEAEAGVHSDFVGVWHHKDGFVLDFAALTSAPAVVETDSGERVTQLNARLAARVRIAPAQVWEIMKALENQLSTWERETGQQPGEPGR